MKLINFLKILLSTIIHCIVVNSSRTNFSKSSLTTSELKLKTAMNSLFKFNIGSKQDNTIQDRFQDYPVVKYSGKPLGEGPIFYQNWNKYFTVLSSKQGNTQGEKKFIKNEFYDMEQAPGFLNKYNPPKSDLIPNPNNFYFILTENYLSVVTSKIVYIIILYLLSNNNNIGRYTKNSKYYRNKINRRRYYFFKQHCSGWDRRLRKLPRRFLLYDKRQAKL